MTNHTLKYWIGRIPALFLYKKICIFFSFFLGRIPCLLIVCIFLTSNAHADNTKFYALKNLPGENEITCVAMLDHCLTGAQNCQRALFGGYLIENNRKKIMLGHFNLYDSSIVWAKSIVIDSLVNVVGISKIEEWVDTTFLLSFNAYDTSTNKFKIGALLVNSTGQIQWVKYYTRDSSEVFANWQAGQRIVGKSVYPGQTKALFFYIGSNGETGTSTEIVIGNSVFQEFEFTDKWEIAYCDPYLNVGTNFMTGSYQNGGFGRDWFLYDNNGNIHSLALPGNQTNTIASRDVYPCYTFPPLFHPSSIFYRSDSNRISYSYQNNMGTWYGQEVKATPEAVRINFLVNDQNGNVMAYSTLNGTNKKHALVWPNGWKERALPDTDLELNAMQGANGSGYYNNVGYIKNIHTIHKTSIIGDIDISYNPPVGCIEEDGEPCTCQNASGGGLKSKTSFNVSLTDTNALYSTGILMPYLVPFCVPEPMIQNGFNFTNPVCAGAIVKVKLANAHPGNVITATLNGVAVPFNAADSTIDLTGLLSYPQCTLHVEYQGVIYNAMKDTSFYVYLPANLSINSMPSPPEVCPGNSVTLSASGGNNYTWSGGIQDGIPFVPVASTVYSVSCTDVYGCINTVTQLVTVKPIPNVTINMQPPNGVVCNGDTAILTATGANSYVWTGGIQNGVGFTPAYTATYTVTATALGCSGTSAQNVIVSNCGACLTSVTINTNPFNIALTESDNWILTSGTVTIPSGDTVKWDSDTTGYVKLNPGFKADYGTVFIAQAYNGCNIGTPSIPGHESFLKKNGESFLEEQLLVFPNPTTGKITLQHPGGLQTIAVYDLVGKLIQKIQASGKTEMQIDMNEYADGTYLLKVAGHKTVKVVKE